MVIEKYGVYSKETASCMAEASLSFFGADISVGITGTTGNVDPANGDSTPGEVFFAICTNKETRTFGLKIPPKDTRYSYKLAAADAVADALLDITACPVSIYQ